LPLSDNRFDHSRPRRFHQRRIRNAATLDGEPVNLAHLLCGKNLHLTIIIARREKSAKGRRAACARRKKLTNITQSSLYQFSLNRSVVFPSSPGNLRKRGRPVAQNSTCFTKQ